ncbi:hypothetical protein Pcinc_006774 [Petrolisthes cinctipes]|uniref:C2H2-type domain-containing protein n=1 Tax=Petrolisthes cinctipes TaxID=88211 RepID=A0AAE1GGL8_PETCI|nr:hypothetical protein Pcinc_006774 [Petrolisthes cinctipes]
MPHRRFDCDKLRNPQLAQNFREACERHLVDPVDQASVEDHWTTLRDAMTRAAEETIGFVSKKNQDWFDENDGTISLLIEAKRQTRLILENQPTAENKRTHKQAVADCQRGIREVQNTWWQRKAADIQNYADQRDLRRFYAATKEVFGPTRSSVGGLKDVDGATTITDSEGILSRWKSHFENLLNDQANTPNDLIRMTPQYPVHHWMSLPPSIQDFDKAIKGMKPGKAPGPDNIPLELLTQVLARFGCPPDFVTLVRGLHDGMVGRVCHQSSLSGPYSINGGLKQGCVLAPTCFSLYTAAMLNEIPPDTPTIDLQFRMDGGVFNLARLRATTKTTKTLLREMQYADDNATPGQTAEDLQRTATTYNTVYERFGMQVNTDKTKALIQHPPGQILPNINTTINEHTLEEVEQFSYLGSILTSTPTCKKDVENRIRAAHSAYGRLSCRVFNNHALTMAKKIMVFQAIVLSTLLYACETWTLYRSDIQSLERFQQYKLRQILKIPWESHTTNVAVLNQASVTSVEATIIHHRLRWAGHVQRMEPFRLPKIMLYGDLANGTRPRGAPKLRYKDQLKRTLALTNIDPSSWEQTARDRATWRRAVHHGTTAFEEKRKENEEAKRRRRRERQEQPRPPPTLPCELCPRLFHHRLGLSSHIRHKHPPRR